MIATTCEDKKIRVFYLASPANPLKVFSGHIAKVFSVKWSPLVEGMFCSSSDDMKVIIWLASTYKINLFLFFNIKLFHLF